MTEDNDRDIIDVKTGIFNDLATRIKLIMRLMADRRVSPFLKILPVGSLLYFLLPDIAPGPIDDMAVIWLGTFLFVELCPPQIVQEHMDAITQSISGGEQDVHPVDGEVIDADFWEYKE